MEKETLIKFIKSYEGGFVNDTDDSGGATNKGITLKTYRLIKPTATVLDLKNISDSDWNLVFTKLFWSKTELITDKAKRYLLTDILWGSGNIRYIQKQLNLSPDNIIGKQTAKAISNISFDKLKEIRRNQLIQISKLRNNKKYLKGWLRRLDAIKSDKLILNNGTSIAL